MDEYDVDVMGGSTGGEPNARSQHGSLDEVASNVESLMKQSQQYAPSSQMPPEITAELQHLDPESRVMVLTDYMNNPAKIGAANVQLEFYRSVVPLLHNLAIDTPRLRAEAEKAVAKARIELKVLERTEPAVVETGAIEADSHLGLAKHKYTLQGITQTTEIKEAESLQRTKAGSIQRIEERAELLGSLDREDTIIEYNVRRTHQQGESELGPRRARIAVRNKAVDVRKDERRVEGREVRSQIRDSKLFWPMIAMSVAMTTCLIIVMGLVL